MNYKSIKSLVIAWGCVLAGAIWLAMKIGMSIEPGFASFKDNFYANVYDFFHFEITPQTPGCVLLAVIAWMIAVATFIQRYGQYAHGKEHGTARWANIPAVNKLLASPNDDQNVIMSERVKVDIHTFEIGSANVLVTGGSGSGKTRNWVKPNLMQLYGSYFIVDPSGELLRDLGHMFQENHYNVSVIDTISLDKDRYNPLDYVENDQDIMTLINNLLESTRPADTHKGEGFWEEAMSLLMQSLMMYVWYCAPSYERNIPTMMYMVRKLLIMEERDKFNSPLDRLFDDLRKEKPNHIAVRTFYAFREKSPGKTAKSVLISLDARLNMLQIDAVQEFLSYDTIDLRRFCTEKSVIFAVTSDVDTTYNFVLNMFLNQFFVYAYRLADRKYGGKLPVPVRIIYEELANTAMPKDFPRVLSTCRKRQISIAIIVQEISQLRKLFKEDWEAIIANTSLRVFLGGESTSQLENISKELGKATIKFDTLNKSGQNTSTNINIAGRELMTLDELRRMKKDECIVFLQYQLPIKDRKMKPESHKRYSQTFSGGAAAYSYKAVQGKEY